MNFKFEKTGICISLVLITVLAGSVWIGLQHQASRTSDTTDTNAPTIQTLGSDGVTFSSPVGLDWVDAGSTAGNYSNLILQSATAENISSIEISIPLKESGSNYSFADEVKPFADISGIHSSTLNGHIGEAITYRQDTRNRKDDVPWVGTVTKERYPSRYSTSPVRLTYSHGDGNDDLDSIWEQVKSSIQWSTPKQSINASTILNDMGASDLSTSELKKLDSQIEDWALYASDQERELGGLDCGSSTAHDQLVVLNQSDKQSISLNNSLLISSTPNLYRWDKATLQAFASDSTVICGVATVVPKAIADDRVVWWNACVGGAGPPEKDSPEYLPTVRCLQAEEVVNRHFGMIE